MVLRNDRPANDPASLVRSATAPPSPHLVSLDRISEPAAANVENTGVAGENEGLILLCAQQMKDGGTRRPPRGGRRSAGGRLLPISI